MYGHVRTRVFNVLARSVDPIRLAREKTVIVLIPVTFDRACNLWEIVFVFVIAVNLEDHRAGLVVPSIAGVGLIDTNSLENIS
jgi:hypothetical protein